MAEKERELDVVVYGATGFVGRLTARYLADAGGGVRIGLAGRSAERLAEVRDGLGAVARDWPLLIADACARWRMLSSQGRVLGNLLLEGVARLAPRD